MELSEPWELQVKSARLINSAARGLARLADTRMRELGLRIGQLPVFVALKGGARLSQRDLARIAGVEQPSMAALLARMERDGLVRREPDPTDGRSSLVSLTAVAMENMRPARAILAQGNQEALQGFSAEEIDRFVEMLERVVANLDAAAPEKKN
ncbi:MarR family transcriptional regulator [Variovorax paradoxus]|uniref:MarR family winged helix-turn-helix transcriptional regulator n=1 Tax=Variovorax paradoxus TaxID=34073 RepID=UPI00215E7017|nr:MarR family transcriptional regulator [Variovorax paradoxus]UVH55132.1 MarR family transcriptional regulator [Variovorax paradoxus]